jgi:hypothetical protein
MYASDSHSWMMFVGSVGSFCSVGSLGPTIANPMTTTTSTTIMAAAATPATAMDLSERWCYHFV